MVSKTDPFGLITSCIMNGGNPTQCAFESAAEAVEGVVDGFSDAFPSVCCDTLKLSTCLADAGGRETAAACSACVVARGRNKKACDVCKKDTSDVAFCFLQHCGIDKCDDGCSENG